MTYEESLQSLGWRLKRELNLGTLVITLKNLLRFYYGCAKLSYHNASAQVGKLASPIPIQGHRISIFTWAQAL